MLTSVSATVFILNLATMVTFATLHDFALQLLLLRITQVLTVVMISHMFLNLKGSNRHGSRDAGSRRVASSSRTKRSEACETEVSLETRATVPKHMASLVGNLGNELMHPSILGHWILDEKVGENCSYLFSFYPSSLYSPPLPSNFDHDHTQK